MATAARQLRPPGLRHHVTLGTKKSLPPAQTRGVPAPGKGRDMDGKAVAGRVLPAPALREGTQRQGVVPPRLASQPPVHLRLSAFFSASCT